MDVNQTPFVLWDAAEDFTAPGAPVRWNEEQKGLLLTQAQPLRVTDLGPAAGLNAWQNADPLLMDSHEQYAQPDGDRIRYWSGRESEFLQDGNLQDVVAPVGTYTDLDVNQSGWLAGAFTNDLNAHGVTLFHLGTRQVTHTRVPHRPRRITLDEHKGENVVWVLSRDHLMRVSGRALPQPYHPDAARFEPMVANPQAPGVDWVEALPSGGWQGLEITSSDTQVFVLAVDNQNEQALLIRPNNGSRQFGLRVLPLAANEAGEVLPFAVDLHWLGRNRLALMSGWTRQEPDCQVIEVLSKNAVWSWRAVHERYPMHNVQNLRFVRSADRRARYPAAHPEPQDPQRIPPARPRLLLGLSRPEYPLQEDIVFEHPLDGRARQVVWHRLFLEACLPSGCRVALYAHGSDDENEVPAALAEMVRQPTLTAYEPAVDGFAQYETLLQVPNRTVSRLCGRYLRIGLRVATSGRSSPVIRRLRAYCPRFSYQEAYLPEHMRQHATAQDGQPNGADVRERILAAFEGMLTPIEHRVSQAERLLDPDVTDPGHLHWIAQALGYDLPAEWPPTRKRALLSCLGHIQRGRGTLSGLLRELEVLTNGEVSRGALVPIETYRLRRTLATALGVDLEDDDHPLTLGTAMSANSIVGGGLILTADDARELMALAAPDLLEDSDRERVRLFFERFSHQLTILVHSSSRVSITQLEALLPRILPAHTAWHLAQTDKPFVLGLAPLLGYHSFLENELRFAGVRLGHTYLGREHTISNHHALSPQDVHAMQRPTEGPSP